MVTHPQPNGWITEIVETRAGQIVARNYGWVGGQIVMVDARREHTPDKGIIQVGPYRLHVLDFIILESAFLCVRDDGPRSWLMVAIYRGSRWVDLIYRRLIVTAAVWGLADWCFNTGELPTWRALHIAKCFEKRRI